MKRTNISPPYPHMLVALFSKGEVLTNSPKNIGRLHRDHPDMVFDETVVAHLYQKDYFRPSKYNDWFHLMWNSPPLVLMARFIRSGKILETDFVVALASCNALSPPYHVYPYDAAFLADLFAPGRSTKQILKCLLAQWPDAQWDRHSHPFAHCPIRTPVTRIRLKA